jgi:hypothetical protein
MTGERVNSPGQHVMTSLIGSARLAKKMEIAVPTPESAAA